jgi:alkanesulfonate monooxygenase SsuD/methylene tetrahydromethanopterin reductase-like flavin-dependent oxidoreductase (luciferase family)
VIEGWHGVPYDAPVGRTREIIEICRKVWRRERLAHSGRYYQIPLPAGGPGGGTGLGKPLKLINRPVRERIPIIVAAIGPRNVELAAELAEGWEPEDQAARIQDAYLDGRKDEAAALVPAELLAGTSLVGPEGLIAERLAALAESGVTTLNVTPLAPTHAERVRLIERIRDLAAA